MARKSVPRPRRALQRVEPQQARAQQTRERLLAVAAELLGEVGIESITTNLICARAGMTPPALYRYFKDKYAILEALGHRLMERQNAVLLAWLASNPPDRDQDEGEHVERLMQATADVTAAEPGALWTLRALHAVPQLTHIRVESHRFVTDRLTDAYALVYPELPRKLLWLRLRIAVEIGFAIDEMLNEEDRIARNDVLHETARLMRWSLVDPPSQRRTRSTRQGRKRSR